jgi:hypothetical protein
VNPRVAEGKWSLHTTTPGLLLHAVRTFSSVVDGGRLYHITKRNIVNTKIIRSRDTTYSTRIPILLEPHLGELPGSSRRISRNDAATGASAAGVRALSEMVGGCTI